MKIASEYTAIVDGTGVDLRTGLGERFKVDADELAEGGWIRVGDAEEHCGRGHCDEGECAPCPYCDEGEVPGAQVLERWHNDNHAGAYRFCYEEPCHALRGDSHS